MLQQATTIEPDNADVQHALGLTLVRRRHYAGALERLRRARELAPDSARYAYVYAVAPKSGGNPAQALTVLEDTDRKYQQMARYWPRSSRSLTNATSQRR